MSQIFLKLINMSISASYIVLAVVLLRFMLRKAPKWIMVVLWGVVAVRLICPFSPQSVISLIPSAETVSPDIMTTQTPTINTGIPIINSTLNPVISESFAANPGDSANPLQIWIPLLTAIWIVGMVALIFYTVISYEKIKRKIGTAVLYKDNIYQSENVVSPFVLGIIRPKIYLPFDMNEKDKEYVIAHEMAHICRKDYLWKPLGFLLLTLHWFNPLMWLGYVLLCRDIELACDEKVIGKLDHDARADYSEALLTCSVNRRMIAACPLAFGEVGVKKRVKSVLNYKKPAFWIIIAAILACVVLAACFLTDPVGKNNDIDKDGYYLLIGANGVYEIKVSTQYTSGGCIHADNTPFKKGEKVWLEQLKSDYDLRGVSIKALDKDGNVIYSLDVPKNSSDEEIAELLSTDAWLIVPDNKYESKNKGLIYSIDSPDGDSDKLLYVYIEDYGCDAEDAKIEFREARIENGNLIFDIHWINDGEGELAIGPYFEVCKYAGSSLLLLKSKGVWLTYLQILMGKGMTIDDAAGMKIEHEITESYNLSAYYDVLTPGKYRFQVYDAWVEFEIIDNFNLISAVYDTAIFDIDGDGLDEICSMRCGYTSGLFTFIFLVQDSASSAVKYESVIYSEVYDLSFQKGADGITRVQGIAQGETPETHIFDISINDGYVNLTENGVPIGEIMLQKKKTASLVYASLIYSYVMDPAYVPDIVIEGNVLYKVNDGVKVRIGTVKETGLNESNFDSYVKFDTSEISRIRENNKIAYEIIPDEAVNGIELYYVLEQKNGEMLIVYGHYKNGENEKEIRFIYSIN